MKNQAYISNIQHFSIHDGTGIRTTVFFQGCTLRCAWCQNPELQSLKPVLLYNKSLCTGCGACANTCFAAIEIKKDKVITHRDQCMQCFSCVSECYFSARNVSSRLMNVEQVYQEIMKDECFYKHSNGGVTLSGGEALLQIDFCLELVKKIKASRISIAIETAGNLPWKNIAVIEPYIDTFLYDLKMVNAHRQEQYIGTNSTLMIQNLYQLSKQTEKIIVRIPLISGINDSEKEFSNILSVVDTAESINIIHILPFHQLGSGKYKMLGRLYNMSNVAEDNQININSCKRLAEERGYIVCVGGISD